MPKSRKRIKKKKTQRRRAKPYEVIKQNFVRFENPFPNDIPFEKRMEILIKIGNKASIDFENEYQKLINYFHEYDPLYLCSFSSYYFSRQEEGIDEEAINGSIDFPPFYLEILQCISLKSERNISMEPLHKNIENFKSTIQNLNRSQSATYSKLLEKAKDQDDIGAILLRTEMMINTLAVRNWSYVEKMEMIAYELATLIEQNFTDSIGFNPIVLLNILFGLVSLTEKKLNIHHKKTISIVKANNYNEAFDKYEECFNVDNTSKSERKEIWEEMKENIKILKSAFLEHSDYFLSDIFTHSIDEIYNYFSKEIAKDIIPKMLDNISFCFGDLSAINKDYIFLDNPIH